MPRGDTYRAVRCKVSVRCQPKRTTRGESLTNCSFGDHICFSKYYPSARMYGNLPAAALCDTTKWPEGAGWCNCSLCSTQEYRGAWDLAERAKYQFRWCRQSLRKERDLMSLSYFNPSNAFLAHSRERTEPVALSCYAGTRCIETTPFLVNLWSRYDCVERKNQAEMFLPRGKKTTTE